MYRYATGVVCRHQTLVGYFGQELGTSDCGACDVCLGELDLVDDPLILGQKILSCVARLGGRFGAQYTAAVLQGSRGERVLGNGHQSLSTYGLLAEHTERQIRDWIGQLTAQGYLEREGEYQTVRLTPKGWELLRGQAAPRLSRPPRKPEPAQRERRSRAAATSWDGVDRGLFEALRGRRLELARAKGVPAYVVLSDATLRSLARHRPTSAEAFLQVFGIGEKKCAEYGDVFLPFIAEYCREHDLPANVGESVLEDPHRSRSTQ
jgi:ATP-dependent DNA helicase RecQ